MDDKLTATLKVNGVMARSPHATVVVPSDKRNNIPEYVGAAVTMAMQRYMVEAETIAPFQWGTITVELDYWPNMVPRTAPKSAPAAPAKPEVLEYTGNYMGSSRQGTLSPSLTKKAITSALGFKPDGPSGDGKVTAEWQFTVDGVECAVWDYKGAKWSTFGPDEALRKVFGTHYTSDADAYVPTR